jgi:hypothetical protein
MPKKSKEKSMKKEGGSQGSSLEIRKTSIRKE